MNDISRASRGAYQSLLYESGDFMSYFRAATPIDVIERIGSTSERAEHLGESTRGAERRALDLRVDAEPLSPAELVRRRDGAQGRDSRSTASRRWSRCSSSGRSFACCSATSSIALAKADLDIAALYSQLAGPLHERFFPVIRREYKSCVDLVLRLTRQRELLEASRILRRAIRLRNPYVDPISFLQVDMLERWRAAGRQNDAVLQALTASIHGIAHAMQTTG